MTLFSGSHNLKSVIAGSEWGNIIAAVKKEMSDLDITFIPDFERYLLSNNKLPDEDLVAIAHIPNNIPDWMRETAAYKPLSKDPFKSAAWKQSKLNCKRLFVFSQDHANSLKEIDVPITILKYPLPSVDLKWSWDAFKNNPEKQIIQIGWWLMRMHALYLLPNSNFKKLWIRKPDNELIEVFKAERSILKNKGIFFDFMDQSVSVDTDSSQIELAELLCKNIVFCHYYDASAPETLLRCIAHQIPILINALPAVREYLGDDYPLYYYFYDDAVKKANDLELVRKTHEYLISLSDTFNQNSKSFASQIRKVLTEN